MLKEILPQIISAALSTVNMKSVCELRLRVGKPVIINTLSGNQFLGVNGLVDNSEQAIIVRKNNIDYILQKCSNNSLYTINDQLINGYVTIFGGIRVGVAGEVVISDGKIQTLKNITSLNIRIPHEVKNCSMPIYHLLTDNGIVRSTLIISPPGCGKTTFLRDFAYQITNRLPYQNILIVDERSEITGIAEGNYSFDKINADIYTNCSKEFGFTNGIRSMKPSVIITDEIDIQKDLTIIANALTCGVKVIATIHANDIVDIKNKVSFKQLLASQLFDRYVVLGNQNGVGTIQGVYNENLGCIYL